MTLRQGPKDPVLPTLMDISVNLSKCLVESIDALIWRFFFLSSQVDQSGAHVGGGGPAQHQQQNKAFNKAKKSWSAEAASGADPRSGQTGGGMARSENDVVASKGPRGYSR